MTTFIAYYHVFTDRAGSQRFRTGSATGHRASPHRSRPARRRVHEHREREEAHRTARSSLRPCRNAAGRKRRWSLPSLTVWVATSLSSPR